MEPDALPPNIVERLEAAAAVSGAELAPEMLEQFWRAAQTLAQLARASGISGYVHAEEALLRGLGPALAFLRWREAPRTGSVADLGAGNGALGAGIAILQPDLRVVLLDRAQRAFTACELLVSRLALPNLRAELSASHPRRRVARQYDAIVFRALAPGGDALALAVTMVRAGGFIGAYHRAGDEWYESGGAAVGALGTVPTVVAGLVMSGFLVPPADSPQ